MQINLSNGNTFDAYWIERASSGNVLLEIADKRLLSNVAADFEGVDSIEETATGRKFEGYVNLIRICRPGNDSTVQITLTR